MVIQKFGGSSLANAERIQNACRIIQQGSHPKVIVLSAMKGITNLLIQTAEQASQGNKEYKNHLTLIKEQHKQCCKDLLKDDYREAYTSIKPMLKELRDILHGAELVQECSARTMDLVMSFGERMSCCITAAYLTHTGTPARMIDARNLIQTDSQYGNASVNMEKTLQLIEKELQPSEKTLPVVTGFIASDEHHITTTLGRNGSDYTASLLGAALRATQVDIWTDVDGVLSADPRIVPHAFVIPEISIEEAMELSYFGAEVIHPYTLLPTIQKEIPVYIKNTFNPKAPGTLISSRAQKSPHIITGIASIDDVALINITGGGMIGLPGMASRVFSALSRAQVNIIMISQASSEHSICLLCRKEEIEKAEDSLRRDLQESLKQGKIQNIEIKYDSTIIAVIGENMRGKPGMTGDLFSELGKKGINILAIAQGSSERNISFVINKQDKEMALNTVHGTFLA